MIKVFILIFSLFLLNTYEVFAQKSPIKFLNNFCTINVDTTNGNKIVFKHLIDLKYKFVNIGEHVTFIDSVRLASCITKQKDTSIIVLKFSNFFIEKGVSLGGLLQKDTSSFINIPFYYEGKIYYEKIICNYTFGKSKLIEYDNPLMLVKDTVSKFFIDDNKDTITMRYPNIVFITYYSVKNVTNSPIWCTKKLIGWHDTDIRDENRNTNQSFVIIPPHTIYKIPIQMNMATKYRFSKSGNYLVFSENIFEVHEFRIKSDFEPKGKYIYK